MNLFLDHWTISIGISTNVVWENGPQFVNKFFAFVCGYFELKALRRIRTTDRRTAKQRSLADQSQHISNSS